MSIIAKLIPCLQRKRVTVLLGAGAPMELYVDGNSPSTKNITLSMLQSKPMKFANGVEVDVELINDIFNRLCTSYRPNAMNPTDQNSAGKVHFEILLHIVEELTTYYWSVQHGTAQKYVAPFANFIQGLNINYDVDDLYVSSRHIIRKIEEAVYRYDSHFHRRENDWYRNFWLSNSKEWDVFNLNYDTTIEQSLGNYEDGYKTIADQEGFQRFSINKLIFNKNHLSTVNHIHGCILYGPDRYNDPNHDVYDYEDNDLYKWPDYQTAFDRWSGQAGGGQRAQNGQEIVQGPIITGLSKTDKVTCLPYDIYRYNFNRRIQKNNCLLIVGYSFGDKYINNMFYRMSQIHGDNKRVVLIDFWNMQTVYEELHRDLGDPADVSDDDLTPEFFEYYFDQNYGNDESLLFIKRVAHHDHDIWHHFDRLSLSAPMISDNGQLMLFIGGFKTAVTQYGNNIQEFLGF